MAVHTFDEYCELEERSSRTKRSGIFSGVDDEYAGYSEYDDETSGFSAVEDMLRESGDLEEIF